MTQIEVTASAMTAASPAQLWETVRARGSSLLGLLKSQQRKDNERSVRNLAELAGRGV